MADNLTEALKAQIVPHNHVAQKLRADAPVVQHHTAWSTHLLSRGTNQLRRWWVAVTVSATRRAEANISNVALHVESGGLVLVVLVLVVLVCDMSNQAEWHVGPTHVWHHHVPRHSCRQRCQHHLQVPGVHVKPWG